MQEWRENKMVAPIWMDELINNNYYMLITRLGGSVKLFEVLFCPFQALS